MQRGSQSQDEDYMLIEPFINEFAELHYQHLDMMLDVDNMSNEELLALEEQIGNVSTGLNEEKIMEFMKKREYEAVKASKSPAAFVGRIMLLEMILGYWIVDMSSMLVASSNG